MRLIKLSTTEFADESKLQDYFDNALPNRNPPGLFIFNGHIAPDGIHPGETILFSFQSRLRYVTKAKTGRQNNTYRAQEEYAYCFVIELPVRKADVSLEKVEQALRDKAGFQKSLSGQGWTKIPDGNQAETVIDELLLSDGGTGTK